MKPSVFRGALSTTALAALSISSIPSLSQGISAEAPGDNTRAGSVSKSSNSTVLEEVVVTAEKRSENLQRVPITVSAVSAESLEGAGLTNTIELAQVVPGLSARVTYNQLEPHIRGVGTTAAGPGVENPVALYVDDVYYGSQVATAFSLIDIDQVAVLKGPQGTLFGRNATGGVIQVTTRQPSSEPGGTLRLSYDNYKTTTVDAYVTGGLSEKVAGSLTARYSTQGEGYGKDVALDREIHKVASDKDFRGKLLVRPSETTTVTLSADYSVREDSLGPNFRPLLPQYTTSLLPGFQDTGSVWDVDSQTADSNRFVSDGASVRLGHDFGAARFVSISAYRWDHLTTVFDPSASPTPGNDIAIDETTSQFTQELQLVSDHGQSFDWQAGLFYYNGKGKDDPLGVHIRPALSGGPDIRIDIRTRETTESAAAYAQATKEVFPSTNLTVGLRYTWERRKFDESQEFFVFDTSIGLLPPTGLPPSRIFKKPTWRLALDHRFNDDLLGYVSYNRGFKSGGYNPHAPDNPPFDPETLDAYEVGMKSEWLNGRLRLNAAAFYYNYKNVQVAKYTSTSLIYNGAGAKIRGLDIDFETKVTANLHLTAGVEFLHARYTDFPLAPFSTPVPGGGAVLFYADAEGRSLNNAPDLTANFAVDYEVPLSKGSLGFNVNSSHSSGYFQEPDNFLKQHAYTMTNAAVFWKFLNDKITAKVFGNNLLDEEVATQVATLPVPPIGYVADYASPPRTYGVSVEYRF